MPILVVLGASVWSPGRATQKSDTDTKTTKAIFHVSWDEFKWNVVPTKIGQKLLLEPSQWAHWTRN